jgi:chloramphenicol 3-O phosphotransferase
MQDRAALQKMTPILFLNGTSSAGKTTVAREFQKMWYEPTLYASIDSFIFMFPEHVLNADEVRKRVLLPLISAFNRSLPNLAGCGFPMIVDYVMESRAWLDECVEYLDGHRVYFVGVKCPLDELERRERARGDRQIGFARWQFERVHRYGSYDLEIDTYVSTPQDCAAQLKELLLSNTEPEAFPRLARGQEISGDRF